MNKVISYIKNNIREIVFLLVLDIFITFNNFISFCSSYLKFANFDLQTILAWDYSAIQNLMPYKDLYYPYGLLSFYKDQNYIFTFLYLLISVLAFNTFFYVFKKVFKQKSVSYVFSIIFLLFICFVSGVENFNRYGISVAITLCISYLFYYKSQSKKIFFFLGLVISSIFWLVHDQGIYSYIVFILFFLANILLDFKNNKKNKKGLNFYAHNFFNFVLGTIFGMSVFLIYLIKYDLVNNFVDYLFISLPEFPLLSKTPFFTFAYTINNLFSISALSLSIFYVAYKFITKPKFSLLTALQIGLIIILLLFEQKNIIRSIEGSITFVSFVLLSIVFWEFVSNFRKNEKLKFLYLFVFAVIMFTFYIGNKTTNTYNFKNFNFLPRSCINSNIKKLVLEGNYLPVINKLKGYKDFDNKVFSFPGNPIFYLLLNQTPPFFTSIYEASSLRSQQDLIKYIKGNIKYIIIDTQNKFIQDGVPNYVRGTYELGYLLNNFAIKDKVGNFIILEKNNKTDFFLDNELNLIPGYKEYLLNIGLESIPYSEGLFKTKYILNSNNKAIIKNVNNRILNLFLANNKISSSKVILLLKNNKKSDKYITVKLESDNNLSTTITFKSCFQSFCVLDLSRIPLFYKERQIKMINYADNISVSIIKMSDYNLNALW